MIEMTDEPFRFLFAVNSQGDVSNWCRIIENLMKILIGLTTRQGNTVAEMNVERNHFG
jgi:hypothetical protein